jgi:hypothetical protein
MIWVTWRHHRAEALWAALLLVGLMALLYVAATPMFTAYRQVQQGTSVAQCVANHSASLNPVCDVLTGQFRGNFGPASFLLLTLAILPALAGMFLGAPLVAREVERGTHQFAWTQGKTRARWILTQLIALIIGVILLFGMFSLYISWWRGPLDLVNGDRFSTGFDLEGVAPVAYALFALALGAATGALIRKTLPAMALTFVGFVALRGVIEFLWRPNFMAPVTRISDLSQGNPTPYNGDWVLNNDFSYIDGAGHHISDATAVATCTGYAKGTSLDFASCLQAHGIKLLNEYQPAGRFWLVQGLESGIFFALAILLFALAAWWVIKRIA